MIQRGSYLSVGDPKDAVIRNRIPAELCEAIAPCDCLQDVVRLGLCCASLSEVHCVRISCRPISRISLGNIRTLYTDKANTANTISSSPKNSTCAEAHAHCACSIFMQVG